MFRINEEIADYLLATKKNPQIPGLLKDELKPFVQRNTHTIGLITPVLATDSDSHFLVEIQVPETEDEHTLHDPRNHKWWFYSRSELKRPSEPLELTRANIDKYCTTSEMIETADCCIELPTDEEKARAKVVQSLDELFLLVPDLQACLDPAKENSYGFRPDSLDFE